MKLLVPGLDGPGTPHDELEGALPPSRCRAWEGGRRGRRRAPVVPSAAGGAGQGLPAALTPPCREGSNGARPSGRKRRREGWGRGGIGRRHLDPPPLELGKRLLRLRMELPLHLLRRR